MGRAAPLGHACRVSTYLATDRLTLRPFAADDADLIIELDSDPAVMRFLSGGVPTPPELVRERDLPSIRAGYERWGGRFGLFAAHEQDGGAFVGWFCLRPERDGPLDEVELGYRLRQEAWGKGYATEVAEALLGKAFSELDVRVVWGATMFLNRASQKVMEKVGMTVTQTLDTPDDMLGVESSELGGFRYEITREQREARRPRVRAG